MIIVIEKESRVNGLFKKYLNFWIKETKEVEVTNFLSKIENIEKGDIIMLEDGCCDEEGNCTKTMWRVAQIK